jgi:hypothetical protein
LEIPEQRFKRFHARSLMERESRCKPVEIAILRIIDSTLRTFNGVPGWPDGGGRKAMSFCDIERPQFVMTGAPLRDVLGTHALN